MLSQRQIRFGELIRSLISECVIRQDIFDEDINITSLTVSFVKMSKDLRIANVYIMPLGGKNQKNILDNFNKKKYLFQKYLSGSKIQSNFTPKINFYLDDTFEEAQKIEQLLQKNNVTRDINNE